VASALSLVLVPAAPGYDPLMWLLWGREIAGGALDTSGGPAFKPLPVGVCALLTVFGDGAPSAWLIIARAGALAAVACAGVLAYRLALEGRPGDRLGATLSGAGACLGVTLLTSLMGLSAAGAAEGLAVACGLGAVLAWHSESRGLALGLGLCCTLIRIEAVVFLAPAAVIVWRSRPGLRPVIALAAVALPALWFGPDALATGDLLRSASRARIPNPGQPALESVPALASLMGAGALVLAPVALATLALRPGRERGAVVIAAAGLGWLALVATMAQLGFSGEERYALPGAAAVTVAGAVGLARLARMSRWAPVAIGVIVLVAAVPRLGALEADGERLAYGLRLSADLERAVKLAGGRDALLACGTPAVGQYRGPLLAYRLEVPKREVIFEHPSRGVVFASRLSHESLAVPEASARYKAVVRAGAWRLSARCPGAIVQPEDGVGADHG